MSTEILLCPVCGKPCRRAAALVGVKFFILCAVDCPYGGTSGDTEAAAIAAHNTVAASVRDHAAVVAENERLRAQVTFEAFRAVNVSRALRWHPDGIASWSPSDWMTAVVGEVGELASLLKMRNRERDGLAGNKFSPTDRQIADELADIFTYLDLLAAALGVDLGLAATRKFNEVSERVGFPERLALAATAPKGADRGE